MFDILRHLTTRIDTNAKPVLCLLEASMDSTARTFFAAERISEFATVMFIGNQDEIRANALASHLCSPYANRANLSPEAYVDAILNIAIVVDPLAPSLESVREFYAQHCFQMLGRKHAQDINYYRNWVKMPQTFGVLSAVDVEGVGRRSHCVLGGLASTSRDFFLPCIRLHPKCGTVFNASLFCFAPDCQPPVYDSDVMILADIAVVVDMTPERLADITIETSRLAYDIMYPDPLGTINTSMLSYSTRGSGSGFTVDMVREAYMIIESRIRSSSDSAFQHINITPELQFGPAVLERAAMQKLDMNDPRNAAAGRSNVLIAPNLETGNVLFHLHIAYYPGASHVLLPGGFTNHSAVDFSRSSKVSDVVAAAAAACVRIQKLQDFNPVLPRYNEELI